MRIERTTHGPWAEAYRCTLGAVELIVATSVGPRIVSLRQGGGPNFLFEDPTETMGVGEWKIRGGHRFWVAPETKATYRPDNAPAATVADGEMLRITAAEEPDGLRKTIEIAPSAGCAGFRIRHILENRGSMLTQGAVWGLTCVKPTGAIIAPWGEGSPDRIDAAGWRTQMIRFWHRWAGTSVDPGSAQYRPRRDHLVIEPSGETGKIGLYSDAGLLAQARPEGTFIKCVRPARHASYPDGGCNLEVYTCGDFIELETLSPLGVIHRGEAVVHDEHWLLTPQVHDAADWPGLIEQMRGVLEA